MEESRKGAESQSRLCLSPAPEPQAPWDAGTCQELSPGRCSQLWAGSLRLTGQSWTAKALDHQRVHALLPEAKAGWFPGDSDWCGYYRGH